MEGKIKIFEVERVRGGKVSIPEGLSYKDAGDHFYRLANQEEERCELSEIIPVFPWDGAIALEEAIREKFGVPKSTTMTVQGMFGPQEASPSTEMVAVSHTETREVIWGGFALPGIVGKVQCGFAKKDGLFVFKASAITIHKFKPTIQALFARTREIAMGQSIYKSKAIEVKFYNEEGDLMALPQIRFLRTEGFNPIFNEDLELRIRANILNHFRMTASVANSGVSLKRGVLLAGKYGTGKTLVANLIAREATMNGWTYVYVPSASELPDALMFARQFQPAVVLVEDIDQVIEDRDEESNSILNVLDGVDGKNVEIVTIMTTNHPEKIHPSMYRPGRIDLPLEVKPPNESTCERLIKYFAGPSLPTDLEDADLLTKACNLLAGTIPATVHEVVKNAKLYALDRTFGKDCSLSGADILHSAHEVLDQQAFITNQLERKDPIDPMAAFGRAIGEEIRTAMDYGFFRHGEILTENRSRIQAILDKESSTSSKNHEIEPAEKN